MRSRPSLSALVSVAAALLGAGAAGCAGQGQEPNVREQAPLNQELADDAAETSQASSHSVALGKIFVVPLDKKSTANVGDAVLKISASPPEVPLAGFAPAGCAQLSRGTNSVHVQFSGCTHRSGLEQLSGGLDATFSNPQATADLHIDITSAPDLVANGRPIFFVAQATVAVSESPGRRIDLTWKAEWKGTTRRGKFVQHVSNYNVILDQEAGEWCSDTAGSTSGSVEKRGLSTTIDSFKVCAGRCPASGTIESTSKLTNERVTIRFDGSNTGHVTDPAGVMHPLALVCTP